MKTIICSQRGSSEWTVKEEGCTGIGEEMMKIQYASITETGARSENEDSILVREKDGCCFFALADGLGSYGNGKIASDAATAASAEIFLADPDADGIPELAIRAAQESVMEKQKNDMLLSSMSTTLAVLYIGEEQAQWSHIGDSRIYFFQERTLKEYTKDHSVPQLLVRLGQIRQDEVRGHPDQNRLLKAIGREWSDRPFDVSLLHALNGTEWFLICSDGFWEYINESQMEQCLKMSDTPEQWLRSMEHVTQKQSEGAVRDNYSAICIRVMK